MLTVSILINGQPLLTRSCFREEEGRYRVDDGSVIEHNYEDGAVILAHKLLDTIKELKRKKFKKEFCFALEKGGFVTEVGNTEEEARRRYYKYNLNAKYQEIHKVFAVRDVDGDGIWKT